MVDVVFVVEVGATVEPTIIGIGRLELVCCLVATALCGELLLWLRMRRVVGVRGIL